MTDDVPAAVRETPLGGMEAFEPQELLGRPRLCGAHVPRRTAARLLAYAHGDPVAPYDEIGLRACAASPTSGAVPLQTLETARLERERAARRSDEWRDTHARAVLLRHRPLALFEGPASFQLEGRL